MELWLMQMVQSIHNAVLDACMQACSILAEQAVLLVLLAAIYWCVDKRAGQRMIFSLLISLSLNCGLKNVFEFPRPFVLYPDALRVLRQETATGYSFPSGHTQSAAAFWSSCFLAFRRRWILWTGIAAVFLVAFSRIYLGVHFPHDVIVGALLGVGTAVVVFLVLQRVSSSRWWMFLLVVGLALALFFPFSLGGAIELDFWQGYGAFLGFFAGFLCEQRFVQFQTAGSWKKKLLRLGVGLVFAALCYVFLGAVFPKTALGSLIKMAVLVFCVSFVYPVIFTRLRF